MLDLQEETTGQQRGEALKTWSQCSPKQNGADCVLQKEDRKEKARETFLNNNASCYSQRKED